MEPKAAFSSHISLSFRLRGSVAAVANHLQTFENCCNLSAKATTDFANQENIHTGEICYV